MKNKTATRIITVLLNALLLVTGSVVLLVFLKREPGAQDFSVEAGVFAFITGLLFFTLTSIESVAMFRISTTTFRSALIAFLIMLYTLSCPDMQMFFSFIGFRIPVRAFEIVGELSFMGGCIAVLDFLLYDYHTGGRKLPRYPLLIAAGVAFALHMAFFESTTRSVATMFFVVAVMVYYIIIQVRVYAAGADDPNFLFAGLIFFSLCGAQAANVLYYMQRAPYLAGLSSGYIWVCFLSYLSFYLVFFINLDKKARRAETFRIQNDRLKMKVLIGQIKPHFIFNALTVIKARYHSDVAKGDKVLDLFSDYLRESISLIDTEVIPFEQELQNLARYIDFVNSSKPTPFEVSYNIETTDFCIPAFTLQPFIENAFKHAKLDEREGGYIMISSEEKEECYEVRIFDNGAGFDLSHMQINGHGIENAKERLKLLVGAEPVIKSAESEGTEVTIRIRSRKKGGKTG